MNRSLALLLLLSLSFTALHAQSMNWRKHAKLGDELFAKAQYQDAAKHYHAAWEKKQSKHELIYQAGNCYALINDYNNAALAYRNAVAKAKKFPDVELKYGMALKQAGQYTEASKQLASYLENYKGSDKEAVAKKIEMEIQGCELGAQLQTYEKSQDIQLELLNFNINSRKTEFAPIPFTDEILYYSSTVNGRAQIFRTQKIRGEWSKSTVPASFPEITEDHFCNGTLTPDNKRFYFTICTTEEGKKGPANRCEIYVIRRLGNVWSTPERLRDYINIKGATTTHPFVVYSGEKEILYFASNRIGGSGGLDIWYVTRDINSAGLDFSFPENVGPLINTAKDEVTPFYDPGNQTLYFSSNGHVSIGGFDIYKSKGSLNKWEKPLHTGIPFNSSADDMHYVQTPSGLGGFLVSNRTYQKFKTTSTDEDIFSFSLEKIANVSYSIEGTVFERTNGTEIDQASVTLYDITIPGQRKFVQNTLAEKGLFTLQILPEKVYEVEVVREGFLPVSVLIDPSKLEGPATTFYESFFLDPTPFESTGPALTDETVIDDGTPPGNLPPGTVRDDIVRKNPYTDETTGEMPTGARMTSGTYYKVQIAAVSKFMENDPMYSSFRSFARIDTEAVPGKNLTRVMIADFASLEDARATREMARDKGFPQAYIVKYTDGKRMGVVK